jgi:hypothetical protein
MQTTATTAVRSHPITVHRTDERSATMRYLPDQGASVTRLAADHGSA